MSKKWITTMLLVAVTVNACGCATVVKGVYQPVTLTSSPSKAQIKVDGVDKGETPMVIKMKRAKSHTVQFDKEGYQSHEAAVVKRTSGWIWGNIFIGGLIGLVIDLITGASNNLEPDNIHAELAPLPATGGA